MSFEKLIGLCKYTATQGFLLVPISWYQMTEQREIIEGYRGYIWNLIAFVSWVKALLELLNLSNFLSLDKIKIICFWFQMVKNDWVWRKVFRRFIIILNISVDIKGDFFFFQLVSGFFRLDSRFKSFFSEELKIPWQHLNSVYAPIYS